MNKVSRLILTSMAALMVLGVEGCSTTKVQPAPAAPQPVYEPPPAPQPVYEPPPEPAPAPPAPEPVYEPKPDRG